ncbi:hypothetical protein GCM10011321_30450 [Youhaiella tibetensis]|jgi:hypothetical protein|nr:hypothetical protein [Youhaiella tibetensis]GGF37378.1 hypothetical protein GCM10011321_30450 [Youhaiella tibetensis]
MLEIYRLLAAFLRTLVEPGPEPDPTAAFTAREWADLPVHHPCRDR